MDYREAEQYLGADHVAWILRQPEPMAACERYAMGAWHANDLRSQSAYLAIKREVFVHRYQNIIDDPKHPTWDVVADGVARDLESGVPGAR